MNIQTEPKVKITVKKDKVKVKKSNPLKGAIIDIDYDTGLKEVFGEEPVDLFSDAKYEAETEDENEVSKEIQKQEEEDMEYLQMLKELDDEENRIKQKRQELMIVKEVKGNANKYKSYIVNKLNENIKSSQDAIKDLQNEILTFQEQLKELEPIQKDTEIMNYLTDNFGNEINELLEKDMPKEFKPKKKKSPIVDDGKEKPKGTRTFIDRKVYPEYLKHKMVFTASGNHKTDKRPTAKVTMDIIFNAETKKFYNMDTDTEYNLLQDANREWCNKRGYEKLGNAWEDFKAFNLVTEKTKSIEFLHLDNWIEKEDVSNYIQDSWEF